MCDFVPASIFVIQIIFSYRIDPLGLSAIILLVDYNKITPGYTTILLFGRLESCLESFLKQLCTAMVFYIRVCYIQNLSLLTDKTPQKAENARLRQSLKL